MRHWTQTREQQAPKGAIKVTPKGFDAVIFVYDRKSDGKPCALAFSGKRNKPDLHALYRSAERREQAIREYLDGLRRTAEFKNEIKAKRRDFTNTFAVGDILHHSWGYDQTQCDFYQVVARTNGTITIRAICSEQVPGSGGYMSAQFVAVPDSFCKNSEPIIKRVQGYDGKAFISMEHGGISLWDGSPQYCSWYA